MGQRAWLEPDDDDDDDDDVDGVLQVEERKKAILEAERERREAMLRRSEDRGLRLEQRRRQERGSIGFAFGSSTPRMLDPVDAPSSSSYWGSRRATSTTDVMTQSCHAGRPTHDAGHGRSAAHGSAKRASSVFGLDAHDAGRWRPFLNPALALSRSLSLSSPGFHWFGRFHWAGGASSSRTTQQQRQQQQRQR